MADVRRDSFDETDRIVKVLFQTGRIVQEYELNEAQDDARVAAYRTALAVGHDGVDTGWTVHGDDPTANQIHVNLGVLMCAGYVVRTTANTVIAGLTTPGGARTDRVYLQLSESEVGDQDPDPVLGEQSRRRQLTVSILVVEGGAVPATTGMPWAGGTYRMELATIARSGGVATITASQPLNTFNLLPATICDEITTLVNGRVERIHSGTSNILEGLGANLPQRFLDPVILAAGGSSIPLSGQSGFDLSGQYLSAPGAVALEGVDSMLRNLGGVPFILLSAAGPGGHMIGADSLERLAPLLAAAGNPKMVVVLRRGTYVITAATPAFTNVTFLGESGPAGEGGTVGYAAIDNQNAANTAGLDLTSCAVENVRFFSSTTSNNKAAAATGQVRFTGCTFDGYVTAEDPGGGGAGFVDFVRCSITNNSTSPLLSTTQTGASAYTGARFIDCTLDHTASTALLSIGPGGGSYREFLFSGCRIILSGSAVAGPPVRSTGLFALADTGANDCIVDAIRVERCNITAVAMFLRQKVGVSEADDATATASQIRDLSFRACRFLFDSAGPEAVYPFAYVFISGAGTDLTGRFGMEDCEFELAAGQFEQETANPEAGFVTLGATWNEVRGLTFHGIRNDLVVTGYGTGRQALLWVTPQKSFLGPTQQRAYGLVDGFTVRDRLAGAAVPTLSSLLGGNTQYGSITFRNVQLDVSNGGVGNDMAGHGLVETMDAGAAPRPFYLEAMDLFAVSEPCVYADADETRVRNCQAATDGDSFVNGANALRLYLEDCTVNRGNHGVYVTCYTHMTRCYITNTTAEGVHLNVGAPGNLHAVVRDCEISNCNGGGAADQVRAEVGAAFNSFVFSGNDLGGNGTTAQLRVTGAPTAAGTVGCDTNNVNTLGTFTNGQPLRFNWGVLAFP